MDETQKRSNIVSIIIPVYNVSLYLSECLDSLVNQTYYHLEIILIDDGSTDGSGKICDAYAEKDRRIKVIHQENQGAANAKNIGLDNVTGSYIMFVDADDLIKRDTIEILLNKLMTTNSDMIQFQFSYVYVNGMFKNQELVHSNYYSNVEFLKKFLYDWTCSLIWNKIFRADLTKDIRFHKERRCIDDEFYTYKIVMNAKTITEIPDNFYSYRQRKSSVMKSVNYETQRTWDAIDNITERCFCVIKKYPELKKAYYTHLLEMYVYICRQFYINVDQIKTVKKMIRKTIIQAVFAGTAIPDVLDAGCLLFQKTQNILNNNTFGTKDHIETDNYQYFD